MICFEVEINGQKVATAGIPGLAVLSVITSWVCSPGQEPGAMIEDLDVSIAGLDSNSEDEEGTHMRWGRRELAPGDTVTVRVLDQETADPPEGPEVIPPPPSTAAMIAQAEATVAHWQKKLERLRERLARGEE